MKMIKNMMNIAVAIIKEKMINMERTCRNTDLSLNNLNQEVTVLGWVSKRRNLGSILFVDLRDRSGIVQIVINDDVKNVPEREVIERKLSEYVRIISELLDLQSQLLKIRK